MAVPDRGPLPAAPRVAALLVVRNAEPWLANVLATVAAQAYPSLDLLAVDNASDDGSEEILARRIPEDRLITLPRNVGFARAVTAALQHDAVREADLVLLIHDDLVLAPDALARMVAAMRSDPTLGVVGPKLREWSESKILQEVGMTIDRLGRAETQLDPAELDQGQHDQPRATLYVSSAGMLIRQEVLQQIGGFDPRYTAFREDLDLCWRAWLGGFRVEVIPQAVGYHISAASRLARPVGRGRPWEARYLAERHTLATLLKNYGLARLLWVLPASVILAVGKTVGFLATRRFYDAIAVLQAYGWNLLRLPGTFRRRRFIQRRRSVSDGELDRLFAAGFPRARAYGEAVGSWLAGGSTRALLDDQDKAPEEPVTGNALVRAVRKHPAASTGVVLLVVYLIGCASLLGRGQLIGGDVAAWPDSAGDFLRAYASPWNGQPVASAAFASPIQALLGVASFVGLGSAWLAQRVLVLVWPVVAWLLALRAGRLLTSRPGPRALGATLYALSPVVLGALSQGEFGALVFAALLPGLLLLAVRMVDPATPPGTAWRSAALLGLGLATVGAASAPMLVLVAPAYVVAVVIGLRTLRGGSRQIVRLVTPGLGATALLSPWLIDLLRYRELADAPTVGLQLWRALLLVPGLLHGLEGVGGVVAAGIVIAVVGAAVLLGFRAQPTAVSGLLLAAVGFAVVAWAVEWWGVAWLWSPALLVPASLALAGLGTLAARWLVGGLREHAFGARQVSIVLLAVVLVVGLIRALAGMVIGPWQELTGAPELVPAFVGADVDRVGPYRVLLLDEESVTTADPEGEQGVVRWAVTEATGPSMIRYGTIPSDQILELIGQGVVAAVGGSDTRAGALLGIANVRYVVLPTEGISEPVLESLVRQPDLEPLPAGRSRVYRVRTWLPRAVVLGDARAEVLISRGDPGLTGSAETLGLRQVRPGRYVGTAPAGGVLVVSEAASPLWGASLAGSELAPVEVPRVNGFRVPDEGGLLVASVTGTLLHRSVISLQALLALGLLSLALRPPGFTTRQVERARGEALPSDLVPQVEAGSDDES